MPVSQNGWPVITSSSDKRLVSHGRITGKVRAGDVYTVLEWFAKEWQETVEPIRRDWSWGWAYRAIRGAVSWSNHASGTAEDYNAPKHPLGVHPNRTMSAKQQKRVRELIKLSGGVLRWGGDYAGRKDTMHVEINASAAAVTAFAKKIRANKVGAKPAPVKPQASKKPTAKLFPHVNLVVDGYWKKLTSRAYQLMLRDAAGTYKGKIDGDFSTLSIKAEQTWLAKLGWYKGKIDGKRGKMTIAALIGFLKSKGLYHTGTRRATRALQRYINSQRKYIRR